MKRPCHAEPAFTLVELLIVCAILPIASIGAYGLISRVEAAGGQIRWQNDAFEAGSSSARLWKQDVALASEVEIAADGGSMILARAAAGGGVLRIEYGLNRGNLERRFRSPQPKVQRLASEVSKLSFARTGEGYKIAIAIRRADGERVLNCQTEAYATQLVTSALEAGAKKP